MKIYCFTWNTESVRFTSKGENSYIYQTVESNLDTILEEKIENNPVDMICISLQESAKPGSHLMSSVIVNMLEKNGYFLLKRSRLMGVGVTTIKSLYNLDLKFRGLRMGVFISKKYMENNDISIDDIKINDKYHYCSGIYNLTLGKGAICFNVSIPDIGSIDIINLHLPFNSASILNPEDRLYEVSKQNDELNNIMKSLCCDVNPAIIMGDFNYRITLKSGESASFVFQKYLSELPTLYRERDELRIEIDKNSFCYGLMEGVDNNGCNFLPSSKLVRGCNVDKFNFGKYDRRMPSWCDRILYKSGKFFDLKCVKYSRFERKESMEWSDHSAIESSVVLKKKKIKKNVS